MATTKLLTLAGSQFGVVGRAQLIDGRGVSASAVARMTKDGRLAPMIRGTYRIVSTPETFEARCMSALLWGGPDAFLGSTSAARLHGLRKFGSDRVRLTLPVTTVRRHPPTDWVVLDRTSWFDAESDHETRDDGLRVATPLRMLFGSAAEVNQFRFDRAAEDAWHRKLTNPTTMADYLATHRGRGRDGVARMEAFLERCGDRHFPAQSGFEQDVIDAVERMLPPVVRQYPLTLANGEIVKLDIALPEIRLAVEPGASWYHGGDAGQARDHDRDLACNEVGWMIIRLDESFRTKLGSAARRVARAYETRARDVTLRR